jgi:hypothetical protein
MSSTRLLFEEWMEGKTVLGVACAISDKKNILGAI